MKFIEVIKIFEAAANSIPGSNDQIITEKLVQTLLKKTGLQTLHKVSTILNSSPNSDFKIYLAIIPKFKYAPITSVDLK